MLAEQLEMNELDIRPETRFADDLGIDSLDVVELIDNIEEEFGIVIVDEHAMEVKTVGDLAELVSSML